MYILSITASLWYDGHFHTCDRYFKISEQKLFVSCRGNRKLKNRLMIMESGSCVEMLLKLIFMYQVKNVISVYYYLL